MQNHPSRPGVETSHGGGPAGGFSEFSPTRRTAVVLVGEGTSAAYLAGALKALADAGLRLDILVGKGVGALVAAFGAIQAGSKLHGSTGLFRAFTKVRPWRLRTPYRAALVCLGVAFGVFLSPALVGLVLLVALPLLAAARIIAPATLDSLFQSVQEQLGSVVSHIDPIYLRAMAFPLALLFALWMIGWFLPAMFRHREGSRGLSRFLGEGFIELTPLVQALERSLWEAVRGASTEPHPSHRKDIGLRYRDLLSASLGQHGFRELIFYALDLDTGQEVPFVLLKDRWRSRLTSRAGALVAEPMDMVGEAAAIFSDALTASISPPALAPAVPVRIPLDARHGGEVHRFASSLLAGQSAITDAVAAGAEQIIYVSGAAASGYSGAGSFEQLVSAAVRQTLETDLRWAKGTPAGPAVFIIRPEKPRLGTFQFSGRALPDGERLELGALVAQGERDAFRLFIQPVVGGVEKPPPAPEVSASAGAGVAGESRPWAEGPKEL